MGHFSITYHNLKLDPVCYISNVHIRISRKNSISVGLFFYNLNSFALMYLLCRLTLTEVPVSISQPEPSGAPFISCLTLALPILSTCVRVYVCVYVASDK